MASFIERIRVTDGRQDQKGSSAHNPVVADDAGSIYFAYMNSSNLMKMMKWDAGTGQITSSTLNPPPWGVSAGDTHHALTLGIDRDGTLHMFGPHHNDELTYYTSNQPYSVNSGWTQQPVTGSSSTGRFCRGMELGIGDFDSRESQTYHACFYGPDKTLYMTVRNQVGTGGSNTWGARSGAGYRYNEQSLLWENLGDNTNPAYMSTGGVPGNGKIPAFVWENRGAMPNGQTNAFYINFSGFPEYDINGRLHFPFSIFTSAEGNNHGGAASTIGYLYSDDDGVTWNTVDGASFASDPICIDAGNLPTVLCPYGPEGTYTWQYAQPTIDAAGDVMVFATNTRQSHTSYRSSWNGSAWIQTSNGINTFGGRANQDSFGVIYHEANPKVFVSSNYGSTWKEYNNGFGGSAGYCMADRRHMQLTNKFLCTSTANTSSTKPITVYEFISDEWQAPEQGPPLVPPSVDLTWTHDGINVDDFRLFRSYNNRIQYSQIAQLAATERAYNDPDLSITSDYNYVVTANNAAGASDPSAVVVTKVQAATITNPAPNANTGEFYTHQYLLDSEAVSPITKTTITGGALTSGWTLSQSGELSNPNPIEETLSFTFTAEDDQGAVTTALVESITIGAGSPPTVTWPYWWQFEEGTGNTAASTGLVAGDAILTGNAVMSGVQAAEGNYSLLTDGTANSFATITDALTLRFGLTDPFSIAIRFWLNASQVSVRMLDKDSNVNYGFVLNASQQLVGRIGGQSRADSVAGVVPINSWRSACIVYDPTAATGSAICRWYHQGTLYDSLNTQQTNDGLSDLVLGAASAGTNMFNGYLDDVRVYDIALSDAQVQTWHDNPGTQML